MISSNTYKQIEVGAASIIAKCERDRAIKELERKLATKLGSGYPSDPTTIAYLSQFYEDDGVTLKKQLPPFVRATWTKQATPKETTTEKQARKKSAEKIAEKIQAEATQKEKTTKTKRSKRAAANASISSESTQTTETTSDKSSEEVHGITICIGSRWLLTTYLYQIARNALLVNSLLAKADIQLVETTASYG